MTKALFKFVGAYLGVMVGSALLLWLLTVILPADRVLQWILWGISPWVALVAYSFFFFQDRFLGLRGDPSVSPLGKRALADQIRRVYTAPDNREVFEVFEQGDTMCVSWAASAHYNQVMAAGGVSLKRVYVLRLDDRNKVARVVMKEKDARWSARAGGLDFSFNYMAGYSVEVQVELLPSIEVSPDGHFRFDIKKLRYDSEEIWGPLQRLVTGAGWRLQVDMLPVRWMRWAFIAGIAALVSPLALINPHRTTAGTPPHQEAQAAAPKPLTPEEVLSSLRQRVRQVPTPLLGNLLQQIMQSPAEHLPAFMREEFRIYADAYARRPDAEPAIDASARRYGALLPEH